MSRCRSTTGGISRFGTRVPTILYWLTGFAGDSRLDAAREVEPAVAAAVML